MREIILFIIIGLTVVGCGESADEIREEGYNEGYGAGLEEQRVHICQKIQRADDHAYEILQDERICL
jgi:hypothetical protein